MIAPDFKMLKALGFQFAGTGLWVNEAKGLCVSLNEESFKTFQAYACNRPSWGRVARNSAGRDIRFRSPQAAAVHLLKQFPEGGFHV